MEPTVEQKAAFGRALTTARKAAGLSGPAIARALRELGFQISHQAYYKWESGSTAPDQRDVLDALDEIVSAGGRVAGALLGDPALVERITALEEQQATTERTLDQILRLLEARRSD